MIGGWTTAEEANQGLREFRNRMGHVIIVPHRIYDEAVKLGVDPKLMKKSNMIPIDVEIQLSVRKAVEFYKKLPPEAQKIMDKEQAISFVWGNISADKHDITREMVEKAWEKLQ